MRNTTLGPILALMLCWFSTAIPAQATPPQTSLTPAPFAASRMATPQYKPWGSTRAPDQILRQGCRNYAYAYTINPPDSDWSAELTLLGPSRATVASATFFSDSDPTRAVAKFRFCRAATQPGRFKIRMKVTTYADDYDLGTHGFVKPGYFRLTRPR